MTRERQSKLNLQNVTWKEGIDIEGDMFYVPVIESTETDQEYVERRNGRGRVRWFSDNLGYGFLHEDGRNDEIFFHHSAIQLPGAKKLRNGQRVVFEYCKTPSGKAIAINLIPIFEKPEALKKYHDSQKDVS